MPCGIYSLEESNRPEQDRAAREYVRAPFADSRAANQSNRESNPGKAKPRRRGRDYRSAPSLHGDARRRKTKFFGDDQRHARRVPRQQRDPRRISLFSEYAKVLSCSPLSPLKRRRTATPREFARCKDAGRKAVFSRPVLCSLSPFAVNLAREIANVRLHLATESNPTWRPSPPGSNQNPAVSNRNRDD